jgi:SCY1-like protein 2
MNETHLWQLKEMVEPLEETRSELTFATEPLSCTLQQAIPTSSTHSRNDDDSLELDEIEVQIYP